MRLGNVETEFVRTQEFDEFINDMKEMINEMKKPRNILEGLMLLSAFAMIYFITILL